MGGASCIIETPISSFSFGQTIFVYQAVLKAVFAQAVYESAEIYKTE